MSDSSVHHHGDAMNEAGSCQNSSGEPVLGLPLDRASSLLPADLLQGDETVILLLKPSPWYILLGSLGTLGTIAMAVVLIQGVPSLFGRNPSLRSDLLTMAMVLAVLRLVWQFFEWLSRTYVLTDRRVIRVAGVLRIQVFQAELRRLQHTQMLFTIRERLFGLGTISFSTAGTGLPEAYWVMLRKPLAVHNIIIKAINRYS